MKDSLEIVKNIDYIYNNPNSFQVLKDFERVIDEVGLYVYENWKDGEVAAGPEISRHWVSVTFMWPRDKMPDPSGAERLLGYDCKISYKKDYLITPRKIRKPDDIRPGTKKGKLDRHPIWLVEIKMPKKVIIDMFAGFNSELPEPAPMPVAQPAEDVATDEAPVQEL